MSLIAALLAAALLGQPDPNSTDEEETPTPAEQVQPPQPKFVQPKPITEGTPAYIDNYQRPDPATYSDQIYAARVQGVAQLDQARQGPLDGSWSLTDAGGGPLMTFQIADPGIGDGEIQGAWRDLRAPAGTASSGFIYTVNYEGSDLVIRFARFDPNTPAVMRLRFQSQGVWAGELTEGATRTPVTLRRPPSPSIMVLPPEMLRSDVVYRPRPPSPPAEVVKQTRCSGKGKHKKCVTVKVRLTGKAAAKARHAREAAADRGRHGKGKASAKGKGGKASSSHAKGGSKKPAPAKKKKR